MHFADFHLINGVCKYLEVKVKNLTSLWTNMNNVMFKQWEYNERYNVYKDNV